MFRNKVSQGTLRGFFGGVSGIACQLINWDGKVLSIARYPCYSNHSLVNTTFDVMI